MRTNTKYFLFLKGLIEQCPVKSWMENGTLDIPGGVPLQCCICQGSVSRVDLGIKEGVRDYRRVGAGGTICGRNAVKEA